MIIWLTGLSGSGKSTIAQGIAEYLHGQGIHPLLIDGDGLREQLCKDLGFSMEDRAENVRRAAAVAMMAARSGLVSLCSLISPVRSERASIRSLCKDARIPYFEIYISTPLETCEKRDPKGLYKRARNGLIPQFTGLDSPYEPPFSPELEISTQHHSVEESIRLATSALEPFLRKHR